MEDHDPQLEILIGKNVVLDTSSPFVYIGKLAEVLKHYVRLEDVDVHDGQESVTSNEIYIIEASKHGIKKNRKQVFVRKDVLISLSCLEDVIEY